MNEIFFMGFNNNARIMLSTDTNKYLVYSHILFSTNYSKDNYNGLDKNQCYTSIRVIMENTGLKRDMVSRKLKELADDGYIEYVFKSTNRHEPSKINVYWNDNLRSSNLYEEKNETEIVIDKTNDNVFIDEYKKYLPKQVTKEIISLINNICNRMDIELFKHILMEVFANKRVKNHYEYFYKTLNVVIDKNLMTVKAYRVDKELYNSKFKKNKEINSAKNISTEVVRKNKFNKFNKFNNFNNTIYQYGDLDDFDNRNLYKEKELSNFGEGDSPNSHTNI